MRNALASVVLAAALLLPACASTGSTTPPPANAKPAPAAAPPAAPQDAGAATAAKPAGETPPAGAKPAAGATETEAPPEEGHGFLHGLLMYLPNRVMDLFDVVRVGVNVGPGIGAQVKATDPLQVTLMTRASLGLGLETLRHSPVYAGSEAAAGVSVVGANADAGLTWYHSPTDIRLELHPLLVGAHAAVDPVEILDFVLGFLTIDLRDDDF